MIVVILWVLLYLLIGLIVMTVVGYSNEKIFSEATELKVLLLLWPVVLMDHGTSFIFSRIVKIPEWIVMKLKYK